YWPWPAIERRGLRSDASVQKFQHSRGDFPAVGFDGEVASVEEMHLGLWVVALERFGAGRCEEWVVFPPDRQRGRVVSAEELVHLRVLLDVLAVVEQQVHLYFDT